MPAMMNLAGSYVKGRLGGMGSFARFLCIEHLRDEFCGVKTASLYCNRDSSPYLKLVDCAVTVDTPDLLVTLCFSRSNQRTRPQREKIVARIKY